MSKVKYDDKYKCQRCGGRNRIIIKDNIEGEISECETYCSVCGFEDYWATGFFQSGIITFEELKESQKK